MQDFLEQAASMSPTINVNQRVFVDRGAYRSARPSRYDIIMFRRPPNISAAPGVTNLIKRIVAVPGDTIVAQNGRVYLDNRPLSEPYLQPGDMTTLLTQQTVPPGHYFVLGDNRTDSLDSRFFGAIPEDTIIGKVHLSACQ